MFVRNSDGSIALATAIFVPVLIAFVGIAVDTLRWVNQQYQLKALTDHLALRGAREFLLSGVTEAQIQAVIQNSLASGIFLKIDREKLIVVAEVDMLDGSVTVDADYESPPALFLSKLDVYEEIVEASSTAVAHAGANLCVVALNENGPDSILLHNDAELVAPDCAVYANSIARDGISVNAKAFMQSNTICVSGGYQGQAASYDPVPLTDCAPTPDPLLDRPSPTLGSPIYRDTVIGAQSKEVAFGARLDSLMEIGEDKGIITEKDRFINHTKYDLDPGVYEGGLIIASDADATFRPGIYVIRGGPFYVERGARVQGEGVGFYLEGDDAVFFFGPDAEIDLTAPTAGEMAGMLFFEDRNAPLGREHIILSNDAQQLLGTIYLPQGKLVIDTTQPVAEASDFTIIVARDMELRGMPKLVLNTGYAGSAVPVPDGVGPMGGNVLLRE